MTIILIIINAHLYIIINIYIYIYIIFFIQFIKSSFIIHDKKY